MLDASIVWLCSDVWHCSHIYQWIVLIKVETPPFISADVAKLGKLQTSNVKVADSNPLYATIFLRKLFASWHTSLHVKTHNQND